MLLRSPIRPRCVVPLSAGEAKKHDLGGLMLEAVNVHLGAKCFPIATGTMVDATILHAPSSTKNATGERDPEMH